MAGNDEFDAEAGTAGKALVALLRDLEIIVIEADGAEAQRNQQRRDHVDTGEIGPQQ